MAMSLPQKHFVETKKLVKNLDIYKIAEWLLNDGYFPESYVLPPTFKVKNFPLQKLQLFKVKPKKNGNSFSPTISDSITISFPKSQLTERTYGIIEPQIYHDIVWHLIREWQVVIKHLFDGNIKIYSYSFPLPVSKKSKSLGKLRAGRMIYEYLEMAENDLVGESHKFKYLLKTDIKNFYPSIYTHSISWALHGKKDAKNDKGIFSKLGTKLDKLFQSANDGCTNGLPIGSAVSDLISEILLTSLDKEFTNELKLKKINYVGARFKDDYRFLCNSKDDANLILKALQLKMRDFNLSLNESKSSIGELPESLYRSWALEYKKISLKYHKKIEFKKFESTLLSVLKLNTLFPETGMIDKFISELTTKKGDLKLELKPKEILKSFSLLISLKERKSQVLPKILSVIELVIYKYANNKAIIRSILIFFKNEVKRQYKNEKENQYELIWIYYFLKTVQNKIKLDFFKSPPNCPLLNSLKLNKQKFFLNQNCAELFIPINNKTCVSLFHHLKTF